ncbi:1-acyl-sn-glycerol-3-phosphate acyltransferase [Candidatus Woesearchaeota archaeon]|nr:1-acyl-sn-glycerol-3-phosphate acyltransferase [Candidatus Woesearchaeota archaeon]
MVYATTKLTIIPTVKLWVRKVNGLENLPKEGAFIAAANHASYFDHLTIASYLISHLDRKVHFLAKKEHFDNVFKKAWHTYAGAIPIDRQSGGKEALKWAIKALRQGKIIAIHPEGTRSLTGKLQKAKTGIARLAIISKVPVIPIGLIGTFEILPKGRYIPKFKRAVMNIGKPMHFPEHYNKKINKKALTEVTTKIMKEIAKLCHQNYNFN